VRKDTFEHSSDSNNKLKKIKDLERERVCVIWYEGLHS